MDAFNIFFNSLLNCLQNFEANSLLMFTHAYKTDQGLRKF